MLYISFASGAVIHMVFGHKSANLKNNQTVPRTINQFFLIDVLLQDIFISVIPCAHSRCDLVKIS